VQCADNQECVDGACADHLMCGASSYEEGDVGCLANWSRCDGADHAFRCVVEGPEWLCTCTTGDVTGDEFIFADDPCERSGIHIAANFVCDWLVPEVEPLP